MSDVMCRPVVDRLTRALSMSAAALALLLFLSSSPALPQQTPGAGSLAADMRSGWQVYIFVSSRMPRRSLLELTREASLANAVLVMRGFDVREGDPVDLAAAQRWIAGLQAECCGTSLLGNVAGAGKAAPARWIVDPRLFERFHVQAAPSFVLAWPGADPQRDAAQVEGDMALANALKFFAQRSRNPSLRAAAAHLYMKSFGGTP